MIIQTTKEMRPRDEHDFYPTPIGLCRAALGMLPRSFRPKTIIDPGAGNGVWGVAARGYWPWTTIEGIELRPSVKPFVYDSWLDSTNYLDWEIGYQRDLIMGNPPYRHAEEFIRKALSELRPAGYLVFLLRLAFLEGQERGAGLWREFPPLKVGVCSRRPSFTDNGKTDATAYAVYIWQKDTHQVPTTMEWITFENEAQLRKKAA